jgi:hypothetical protein
MKFRIAILLATTAAAAVAQQSNAYVFFAPGGVTNGSNVNMTLHAGGGGDLLIKKGIGVNVEIGALGPAEDFSQAVAVFSPGGAYYFRRGDEHKVEPFVAGGYTLMFRDGHANLGYAGGGVNYWFRPKLGLRLEFRDHFYFGGGGSDTNFFGLRVGLAFR